MGRAVLTFILQWWLLAWALWYVGSKNGRVAIVTAMSRWWSAWVCISSGNGGVAVIIMILRSLELPSA